jgi:rubrerythrin
MTPCIKNRLRISYEHMKQLTCPFCSYSWTPRVENPKACPDCKVRLKSKTKTAKIRKTHEKIKLSVGKEFMLFSRGNKKNGKL